MADSKNAEIKIRTLDETGSGFQSVSTRFENFDQQVQNLEKNLKPLEEILKAGVEASGALSGLGAVAKNSGNLAGAFGDLQAAFLGVKDAAAEAGESLGLAGKTMKVLMDAGAAGTQVFGGLMAAFEVGKQLKVGYIALRTVIYEMDAVQKAAAASTAALGAAQTGCAAKTGILTTATHLWNYALMMNPLVAWTVAIGAAIAAIGAAVAFINWCTDKEYDNTEAIDANIDAIRRQKEAHESSRGLMESYGDRMGTLSQKEKLSRTEKAELAEIVKELTARYGNLGIEIDKTTGKIDNYAKAQRALKRAMLEEEKADADAELRALEKKGRQLSKAFRESKKGWLWNTEGDEEIRQKIIENDRAIEDAKKRRTTAANSLDMMDLEKKKKSTEDRLKKEEERIKIYQDGLAVQKSIQEEIANESRNALERELAGLREKIQARKEELDQLKNEGKITQKQMELELGKLKELGAEREKQIRARHDAAEAEKLAQKERAEAEADKRQKAELGAYAEKITAQEAQRAAADAERTEDEKLSGMKPEEAIEKVKELLANTQYSMEAAKQDYEVLFEEAAKDGVLTDEEKKRLDDQNAVWQESVRQHDRYRSRLEQAQNRLKESTQNAQEIAAAGPVESITRGSVEALRKEMALGTKNPMLEAMEKAERKRDRQAKRQIELAEENNKIQKEKQTQFKAV